MWVLLIIHRSVKFGDYRLCRIGDIKLLICHVNSRDHVVRGSRGIMDELPSCGHRRVTLMLPEKEIFCFSLVMWPHVPKWSIGYVALWMDACHPKSQPTQVLCQFLLKIHNLFVDLRWSVTYASNQPVKIAFLLQTQACTWTAKRAIGHRSIV